MASVFDFFFTRTRDAVKIASGFVCFLCDNPTLSLASPFFGVPAAQDYDLADDLASGEDTPIIYAWRPGAGLQQHPNTKRGDALLNFQDGTVTQNCDSSTEYYALHGALLLVAWMIIAPYGIYQAR